MHIGIFTKMAQLNPDGGVSKVMLTCGDDWLRDVDDVGQRYPHPVPQDWKAYWDSIYKTWEIRYMHQPCEATSGIALTAWTLPKSGTGVPDIVVICKPALRNSDELLHSPEDNRVTLNDLSWKSLPLTLFHEMLHTHLFGYCMRYLVITWTPGRHC